jgi:protein TonB
MAYVDRDRTSTQLTVAVGVGLFTAVFLFGLVTALNFSAIKKKFTETVTIDPTKNPPKPPPKKPLPPPPKQVMKEITVVKPLNTPVVVDHTPVVQQQVVQKVEVKTEVPVSQAAGAVLRSGGQQSFSSDDYPESSIRNQEAGRTSAHFTIGPDGRVSNCTTDGRPSAALAAVTCKIIMREFKYKPALDDDGKPKTSEGSRSVMWQLPPEE